MAGDVGSEIDVLNVGFVFNVGSTADVELEGLGAEALSVELEGTTESDRKVGGGAEEDLEGSDSSNGGFEKSGSRTGGRCVNSIVNGVYGLMYFGPS